MKRIFCISIFLLFLISVHAEEFLFKEFEIGESFSTVSLQMKSYSSLKPLEEHFYATDIFSNKKSIRTLVSRKSFIDASPLWHPTIPACNLPTGCQGI